MKESNPIPDALLLTGREAAQQLKISQRKLSALTKSGEVRAVRLGHAVRYSREDLLDLIERCRTA
jgi:excisionase family DNA binding protein